MAARFGVPLLGSLPLDPLLLAACEAGRCYVTRRPAAPGVAPFLRVVERIVGAVEGPSALLTVEAEEEEGAGGAAAAAEGGAAPPAPS